MIFSSSWRKTRPLVVEEGHTEYDNYKEDATAQRPSSQKIGSAKSSMLNSDEEIVEDDDDPDISLIAKSLEATHDVYRVSSLEYFRGEPFRNMHSES